MNRETLDTIRVLYCAPYSLALYGIPYEMNREIGQAPRHLWEADQSRMSPDVNPTKGWIHLDERDPVVAAWLAEVRARDGLPGYPHEWVTLTKGGNT